jgi:glycosyltransferase involved in cell wall biosynthesis
MMAGKSKPKLLFISPHLPRFDKTSGDLRMYRLLEILSRDHEIVFLAQGETGDGQKEDARYLDALANLKIATHVKDYSLVKILLTQSFKAAIIEFYYIADHYIPRIKILQPKCHVIVDTVDIHYRRAYTKYLVTKNPEDLSVAEKTKREELRTYKKADVIVTVTDEDGEVLKNDCPGLNIKTIPNIHDPVMSPHENDNRNLLFVGGFSHDPNVDAMLYFCEQIFPSIREAVPDCKLTIIGSNPPEEIRRLQNDFIQVIGFTPSLDPFFGNSYVSVAPLRFGAGMKGKVGEAMSQGLPVVTTSIGAQGMGLVHRHNAMICDSPSEYAASVVELIQNRELYEDIRRNAFDHVKNTCGTVVVEKMVNNMMEQLEYITPIPMKFGEKVGIASKFIGKMFS